MGLGTGLCSRLTLSHSKDWSECLRAELGTDMVPSWGSSREALSLLCPRLACPGTAQWAVWVALCCLGLPPCPLLPHGCPSPGPHWPLWWLLWDSLKATADLSPSRQSKNRCFHRGHLRSLNFLPLEPMPVVAQ